jgi:hypothetical protein
VGLVFEEDQTVAGTNGETAINASSVTDLGFATTTTAPTLVTLPEPFNGHLERYEGMLVTIQTADNNRMRVAQNYFLGRYGQLTLSSPDDAGVNGPLFTPTQLFPPSTLASSAAQTLFASHQRRFLVLDDGVDVLQSGDNPDVVPYLGCTEAGAPPVRVLRAGDFASNLTGVLDWGLISTSTYDYRLQPLDTSSVTFTTGNPRPTAVPNPTATYEVVAYNVLNYFTTLVKNDSNARGAYDGIELKRQTDKLVIALQKLNADVLGLVELQNNTAAIETLVNGSDAFPGGMIDGQVISGLNDVMGAGTYAAIQTGVTGTDQIKVGFIYKPATTETVGLPQVIPAIVNGQDSLLTRNRPSIAQTFRQRSNGEVFTVVVNHWKSKGSTCAGGVLNDPDLGDLAGNCNLTRKAIAENIVDWLATDPTSSGDPDFLIIGDMNAYSQEDPIEALRDGGYVDLVDRDIGPAHYSFIFDGQMGALDHGFASPSMAEQILNTASWKINADEPKNIDYEDFFNQVGCYNAAEFRSSDHDPLSLSMALGAPDPVPALNTKSSLLLLALFGLVGVGLSRRSRR